MASMAAAIAAARSASGGNRPLDERERQRFSYFSSLSPMARKIMLDKERVRQRAGPAWERMEPRQQEQLIDQCLLQPQLQARYALHRGTSPAEEPSAYPSLSLQTGQKLVRFGEEDITWQDEHSAPFSWETKSQMEFSVASLPTQEQSGVSSLLTEQKQPAKMVQGSQAPKGAHVVQSTKPPQGSKTPSMDGPAPARKEEESAFWKISAERSRIEGEETEFQSLTPSQIKSLEKGEKALPSYCRQESGSKDKEAVRVEKPTMSWQEKPIAQSFSYSASPSKASAAYPSVVSAAYPVVTPAVSQSKPPSAYPSVTSAAYSAVTFAASPSKASVACPSVTSAASSAVTSVASPSKASAAYPTVYSAAYPAVTSEAYSSMSSAAYPSLVSVASQSVPCATTEHEKQRPSQSSVSTLDDVFLPEVAQQTSSVARTLSNDEANEKGDSFLPDQQTFSEINTSNVVLKTGFDFLDNW